MTAMEMIASASTWSSDRPAGADCFAMLRRSAVRTRT